MAKADDVYLAVDIYGHSVLGAYPTEGEAWQAVNNTAAYCVVYKVKAQVVVEEAP